MAEPLALHTHLAVGVLPALVPVPQQLAPSVERDIHNSITAYNLDKVSPNNQINQIKTLNARFSKSIHIQIICRHTTDTHYRLLGLGLLGFPKLTLFWSGIKIGGGSRKWAIATYLLLLR